MIDKGTAEQALEWAFNHMPDATMDTDTFMRDWERGDLDEYPDFFGWLGAQLPPVIPPLVSAASYLLERFDEAERDMTVTFTAGLAIAHIKPAADQLRALLT